MRSPREGSEEAREIREGERWAGYRVASGVEVRVGTAGDPQVSITPGGGSTWLLGPSR